MTTRQFEIGSRAGWIESHHVEFRENTFTVARDGLISIGPADYSPAEIRRHVSTPNLGGSQSRILKLLPTSFGEKSRLSPPRHGSPKQAWNNRLEQPTIFHDYQTRQPIDVSKRFCITPSSSLVDNSVFEKISPSGKRILHKIDFTKERRFFKTYPDLVVEFHDVKYDSKQLKKKTPLGVIPKARRLPIKLSEFDVGNESHYRTEHESKIAAVSSEAQSSSTTQMPLSPIKRPIVKQKYTGPVIVLDSSCYSNMKKDLHFEISPGTIAKVVPKNIFGSILAVPKRHKSRTVGHNMMSED